jgi:hypothetical protein
MKCLDSTQQSWSFIDGRDGGTKKITVALANEQIARIRARAELLKNKRVRKTIEFESWRIDIRVGDLIRVIQENYLVTKVRISINHKKTLSKIEGVRYADSL